MKLNIQYLIFNISILILIFYFLFSLFLYSPILGSFFVSDDFDWLARAKNIPLTFENYFLNNTDAAPGGGVYRPLTSLSFWLNYQVNGLNPLGYHLINIVLHALNAFLVFWVVLLLIRRDDKAMLCHSNQGATIISFLAGLFFTILPNHSEAVSWISGRNDVLVTFFYLLSLFFYLHFRQKSKFYFLLLSLFCFLLSLLSKEMAMTLPLILIMYELLWHFGKKDRSWRSIGQRVIYLAPFVCLFACFFVFRYYATGLFYGSYSSASLNFTWSRAIDTFIGGLVNHFFSGSHRLVVVQWLSRYGHWALGAVVIAIFILVKTLKIVVLFRCLKTQSKLYLFSVLFFIFTLGPVYYLKFNHLTGEGERFFYLPSAGIAILFSLLIYILISNIQYPILNIKYLILKTTRLMILWGLIILLSGYFGSLLYQKNLVWQKAGQLSQSLLIDFDRETNLQNGEGTVILGMPDNIQGAPVFRNGWLAALHFFYPHYRPDVLITKVGLNLTAANFNQEIVNWQELADGYVGLPLVSDHLFYGAKNLQSADYQMIINDYETNISSGRQVEIYFTPRFLQQLSAKKINFLVFDKGHLNASKPFKIDALDGL